MMRVEPAPRKFPARPTGMWITEPSTAGVRARVQQAGRQAPTVTSGVLEPASLTLADARLSMRTPDDAAIAATPTPWR
jgi:hypothetical protein